MQEARGGLTQIMATALAEREYGEDIIQSERERGKVTPKGDGHFGSQQPELWESDRGGSAPGHVSAVPGPEDGRVAQFVAPLRSSREHLDNAQRVAHLGSAEINLATGVEVWSDEMYRIFGFEPGSVAPSFQTMFDLVHPDDRAALCDVRDRTRAGENVPQFDFRVVRRDGDVRWLRRQAEITRDATGRMTGFVVSILDETERRRAEIDLEERQRELARSHEQLLRAQRLAKLGSLERDFRTGSERWSDEFWRILGLEPSPSHNFDTYLAAVHPDDRAIVIASRSTLSTGAEPEGGEIRILRPDGEVRWLYRQFEILRGEDGKPIGLVATFMDVTERKRAELELRERGAELRRSRQHLSEAQLVGGVGSAELDLQTGQAYWSDEYYRIIGLVPGEVRPELQSLLPHVHRDDRDMMSAVVARTFAGEDNPPVEFRILRADGEVRWIRRQQAFSRGPEGIPQKVIVTCQDITERKQFEKELSERASELRESREHLGLAQRVARMGSAVIDMRTGVSQWSDELFDLLGVDRATTPGSEVFLATVHPDDREMVRNRRQEWIGGRPAEADDWRIVLPSGEERWLHADGGFVSGEDGERRKVVLTFQDITERKRAQRERAELERLLAQSQRMEAIGQLTGGIAHDFNNLLSVIIGRLQMIDEEIDGRPDLRDWVRACLRAAERGATLTRSMLAFARKQALKPTDIELATVVGELMDLLPRTLGEAVEIQVDFAKDLWRCKTDPGQLQNALLNLALNARDAMPDGGRLTVLGRNTVLDDEHADLQGRVQPGEYVMLSVSDTGTGMTPDVIERAFEPFFTTKEVGKGSGLGLSMVYGFVKQSGGHVNIHSEPGRGTTVRLYLPRAASSSAAADAPRSAHVARGEETILVVEDDEDMRKLAIAMLGKLGYRVLAAGRGSEALSVLAEHAEAALLLTDVTLPGGMGGHAIAKVARDIRPGLRVVYMSGYSEETVSRQGCFEPRVRLLHKPFHIKELAAEIRAALDEA